MFDNYRKLIKVLLQLLGKTADELLTRQIGWVKNLPFFDDLSVKDYTTLISNTWYVMIKDSMNTYLNKYDSIYSILIELLSLTI